jgi:hypothetical protein
LGDSVDEPWQGIWEPLFFARTMFPQMPEPERQDLAERALRELLNAGLICFFKSPPGESPEATVERGVSVLDQVVAEREISSPGWRTVPLGAAHTWFGGTPEGERAVRQRWPGTTTPQFRSEALKYLWRETADWFWLSSASMASAACRCNVGSTWL